MYITDDLSQPQKWQIPNTDSTKTTIPANGFLLLWADDQPAQGVLHLGFKLSGGGEQIGLFNQDSLIFLDSLSYGVQSSNISFGRQPDGSSFWNFFGNSTPGAANTTTGNLGIAPSPSVSLEGGFYNGTPSITLTVADTNAVIYYTLDNSTPFSSSLLYTGPIVIDSTKALRARAFRPGYLPGEVVTHTYIIDAPSTLPVVSLVTDDNNLWGPSGIYTNRTRGWERPVSIELFETDGTLGFRQDGGIKIHAPDGRPQQSLRLYARSSYGNNTFDYRIFPDRPITSFKRIILRNSGNDGLQVNTLDKKFSPEVVQTHAHMRDVVMHTLYREEGVENINSAFRPAVVYLNGEYWGIYYIRERQDQHFIESHFGTDNIDLLERAFNYPGNRNAIKGDWIQYDLMENFTEVNNLADPAKYAQVQEMMDVENFSDYWTFQVFAGNFDWLINNIKLWRPRQPDSKFKWMLWDMDHGLGLEHFAYGEPEWNTLAWSTDTVGVRVNGGTSTVLIRNLLENPHFKQNFINRFADLLNTTFRSTNLLRIVDSLSAVLAQEMPSHAARWNTNIIAWESGTLELKNYINQRPGFVWGHIMEKFDLADTTRVKLQVSPPNSGKILLNSLTLNDVFPWQGAYFKDAPIKVQAVPNPGYRFAGWNDGPQPNQAYFVTQLTDSMDLTAFFEVDTSHVPASQIMINEINYAAAAQFDAKDWVEIHNPYAEAIDIGSWYFQDDDDDHRFTFPVGTALPPFGYLALCRDTTVFKAFFPETENIIGNMDFGLSNNGELLRLSNSTGEIVDVVLYGSQAPWPNTPNGGGPTLELSSPLLDNIFPESWHASVEIGGTPGRMNSALVGVVDAEEKIPTEVRLLPNYPNPFNPGTTIKYSVPKSAQVRLAVYDVLGKRIRNLVSEQKAPGSYSVYWNGRDTHRKPVSSGVYIYLLQVGDVYKYRKMVLLK